MVVMGGRPMVLTGHDLAPERRVVTCFDGRREREVPFKDMLEAIGASGAVFGYVAVNEGGDR